MHLLLVFMLIVIPGKILKFRIGDVSIFKHSSSYLSGIKVYTS